MFQDERGGLGRHTFNMEDRRKTGRKRQRWHKSREKKHRQDR